MHKIRIRNYSRTKNATSILLPLRQNDRDKRLNFPHWL